MGYLARILMFISHTTFIFRHFNNPQQLDHYNDVILTDPELACFHACNVLKGPFPEGEHLMAREAHLSYVYARDALKGPFKLGELALSRHDMYSYRYAADVLKEPFYGRIGYVFDKKNRTDKEYRLDSVLESQI